MNKYVFTFDLMDKYTPDIVIKNYLTQIEEATRGYVVGEIKEYNGPISSYTKTVGLATAIGALQTASESVKVDIQNDLGEQGIENYRYEVFLTVKNLEHYKYRMMFVNYGTVSYPVTIVMNETLVPEYSNKRTDTFRIGSMAELEDMLYTIINSSTMIRLIQNLINESLRQEAKKEDMGVKNIVTEKSSNEVRN